mmetsp:Transcript_43993/g.130266  ORF Transcript_43993/g.130266 Transcript_43993/m.130266 type:complete len:239 (-) Transcript_43993:253-969(-)
MEGLLVEADETEELELVQRAVPGEHPERLRHVLVAGLGVAQAQQGLGKVAPVDLAVAPQAAEDRDPPRVLVLGHGPPLLGAEGLRVPGEQMGHGPPLLGARRVEGGLGLTRDRGRPGVARVAALPLEPLAQPAPSEGGRRPLGRRRRPRLVLGGALGAAAASPRGGGARRLHRRSSLRPRPDSAEFRILRRPLIGGRALRSSLRPCVGRARRRVGRLWILHLRLLRGAGAGGNALPFA